MSVVYCNCYCLKSMLINPALAVLFLGALLLGAYYIFVRKKKRKKPHFSLLKTAGMALFFLGFVLMLVYILLPFILSVLVGGSVSWWQYDCLRPAIS